MSCKPDLGSKRVRAQGYFIGIFGIEEIVSESWHSQTIDTGNCGNFENGGT
jgi:hypothetical protein